MLAPPMTTTRAAVFASGSLAAAMFQRQLVSETTDQWDLEWWTEIPAAEKTESNLVVSVNVKLYGDFMESMGEKSQKKVLKVDKMLRC